MRSPRLATLTRVSCGASRRTLLAATVALLSSTALPAQERAAAPRRPNVVLMLADDLGCAEIYGQEKIQKPNLDRLAKESLEFWFCYAGAPVCAPSRCVLLTGLHTGHAEIRANQEAQNERGELIDGQAPLSAKALTIAKLFQRSGYATAAFGKWGLGEPGTSGAPNAQGFDFFYGITCQRVAHSYYPRFVWRNDKQELLNEHPVPGHAKQPEGEVRLEDWRGEHHVSTAIRDEALRWIATRKDDSQPFFLYLPFLEPHPALQPEPSYLDAYPASWDERPYRGECGYTPHPRPRAAYAAMVSQLDDNVGRILHALEEAGCAENTIVLFTSDNGPAEEPSGETPFGVGGVDLEFFGGTNGLKGRKGSVYEGGLRVPLLARWPGHIAAGICFEPLHFADFLPTLCACAQIETPKGLDGIDVSAFFEGRKLATKHPPMIWVFPDYGGQVAVRFGHWKLLRRGLMAQKLFGWELYDVQGGGEEINLTEVMTSPFQEGKAILRKGVTENERFPIDILY